jgi:hypothetical protein
MGGHRAHAWFLFGMDFPYVVSRRLQTEQKNQKNKPFSWPRKVTYENEIL